MRLTIVIIIILILMGLSYNAGLTENKLPDLTEPQFITIKGVALNPDHIVIFWKQNNTLHLMTVLVLHSGTGIVTIITNEN